MNETKPIAETNNYIVLNEYTASWQQPQGYQKYHHPLSVVALTTKNTKDTKHTSNTLHF